jgi:hypothetical protein
MRLARIIHQPWDKPFRARAMDLYLEDNPERWWCAKVRGMGRDAGQAPYKSLELQSQVPSPVTARPFGRPCVAVFL